MPGARRARVLAAAGGAAVAVIAATAGAAEARPSVHHSTYFTASTAASALHVSFTQSPAASIITKSLVSESAGYAQSSFGSGGTSQAIAAPFYPGDLVVGGPELLCTQLFSCPFTPPSYPLLAAASYPRTRTASLSAGHSAGAGPVTVRPAAAHARATQSANSATTATTSSGLLTGTPLAVSIGSSATSIRTSTSGGVLHVVARAALSRIRIGPLLHIGAVRTVDHVVIRHGHRPVDRPRSRISGVTLAGIPARIDRDGIHLAGHKLPGIVTRLARSGVRVRTLPTIRHDRPGKARSSAGGLAIDLSVPLTKAPYVPNPLSKVPPFNQIPGISLAGTYLGTVQLGGAGVAGALQVQNDAAPPPPPSQSVTPPPVIRHAHHGTAGATAATKLPGVKAPKGGAPPPAVASAPTGSSVLLGLDRDDLMTVYLVLAFGTAGLFLGWRGSTAWRRRSWAVERRR